MTWYWDERKRKRRRGSAALWRRARRLAVYAIVGVFALGAIVAVVQWGIDYGCSRTSPGAVERTVRIFQRSLAVSAWDRACRSLSSRLQREYAAIGDGGCRSGLRSAVEQGAVRAAPITTNKVNGSQTQATVDTREGRYTLRKAEDADCDAWRIESIRRWDR